MAGLPVTIRLLDPPLHEFLPHTEADIAEVAQAMGAEPAKLRQRAQELSEFNPMLGLSRRAARRGFSGNRRDAGARDFRGGGRPRRSRPACR